MLSSALSFTAISDRNAKTGFAPVDPAGVLAKVRDLPVSTWSYKADEAALRHMGTMA